jgi:putative phosphoribosyl transferase
MDIRYFNQVEITIGKITLSGELFIPLKAKAIIVFSHGSGSSRFSKRNQMVAKHLQENNFGTLLFDLLTEEEDINYSNRFDVDLLSKRLAGAATWLEQFPAAKNCRIGFFGASTGAASALRVAAIMPEIFAVISRGGRPDLAMSELPKVHAPTLFIVGSLDYNVIQLNQKAFQQLSCEKKLEIIPGATHLFEEQGTMEKVCVLATSWFKKYLEPSKILK